jgi:hypothetical protein
LDNISHEKQSVKGKMEKTRKKIRNESDEKRQDKMSGDRRPSPFHMMEIDEVTGKLQAAELPRIESSADH